MKHSSSKLICSLFLISTFLLHLSSSQSCGESGATRNDVAAKVERIVVEKLGVNQEDVGLDKSFTDDLGADSLDLVELILAFKEEFNIEIPDEDAEGLKTVGQAVDYICSRS